MGAAPEPKPEASPLGLRRGERGLPRRAATGRRSFATTLRTLDAVAASGARVAVHVSDLDRGNVVVAGDDHFTHPIGDLGVVPVLIEVAAAVESGDLDPAEILERPRTGTLPQPGLWRRMKTPGLPLSDLAVLAAVGADALAVNALLERVGIEAVRARIESIGLTRVAVLDLLREERGPDDAPHFALGCARELAELFGAIVSSRVVSPVVSAQLAEWLTLDRDVSMVGSATGLDPFVPDDDEHGLLFVNRTGRARGVRAEAGVLAGPRAGVSYALIVCFDDLSIAHRLRAHDAFRTLGVDLMEYVH